MNVISMKLGLVCGSVALLLPSVASAEDPYSYAWHDSRMKSGFGVSTVLGGGVSGFTNETMRDSVTTDVSGLWDLRVTIGSHTPIGFDITYVGTASNIDALIGAQSGTLVGTSTEGAVRYNILPHHTWNPYAFIGIGWQRYDITGGTFTLSDSGMNESDNTFVVPCGVGLSYRNPNGLVVDLHGTFRSIKNSELVLETAGGEDYAPMDTWAATGAVGYEF